MPSYAVSDTPGQRTWPTSDSYIKFRGAPEPFVWFAPTPPPEPRRPPIARGELYAAALQLDEYSEAAREALRAGDDAGVRHALEVLRSIVEVVIGQLRGSSSEYLPATLQ